MTIVTATPKKTIECRPVRRPAVSPAFTPDCTPSPPDPPPSSTVRSLPVVGAAAQRDVDGTGIELDRRAVGAPVRRRTRGQVGEDPGGDGWEMGTDGLGQRAHPQVDAIVECQLGVLAEVLDGTLQFASVAFGDE